MTAHLLKPAAASAFALALLTAPAGAQDGSSVWDVDGDAGIGEDEFGRDSAEGSIFDASGGNGELGESDFGPGLDAEDGFGERNREGDEGLSDDDPRLGAPWQDPEEGRGIMEDSDVGERDDAPD